MAKEKKSTNQQVFVITSEIYPEPLLGDCIKMGLLEYGYDAKLLTNMEQVREMIESLSKNDAIVLLTYGIAGMIESLLQDDPTPSPDREEEIMSEIKNIIFQMRTKGAKILLVGSKDLLDILSFLEVDARLKIPAGIEAFVGQLKSMAIKP